MSDSDVTLVAGFMAEDFERRYLQRYKYSWLTKESAISVLVSYGISGVLRVLQRVVLYRNACKLCTCWDRNPILVSCEWDR
jgi:hypothetical protein